jgi:hypothetical protein
MWYDAEIRSIVSGAHALICVKPVGNDFLGRLKL